MQPEKCLIGADFGRSERRRVRVIGFRGLMSKVVGLSSGSSAASEKPLRMGVIGAGVMGSNHARVFCGLQGVQFVGGG